MNRIKEYIETIKQELNISENSSLNLGNKMHFPMLIFMNGDNSEKTFCALKDNFRQIWPNSYSKIAFAKVEDYNNYKLNIYFGNGNETFENIDDVLCELRSIENTDYYISMNNQNIYSIIDTSCVKTLNEFIAQYLLVDKMLEQKILSNVLLLKIVILDERNNKELTKEIRNYLSSLNCSYNTLLLATRTMKNTFTKIDDLFDTLAGCIIASNNDAETSKDDMSFKRRIDCLMGGNAKVISVSHSVLKKPTEEIVIQMFIEIAKIAKSKFVCEPAFTIEEWKQTVGIEKNGFIQEMEVFLEELKSKIDCSSLEYFPFNKPVENIDLEMTYKEFKKNIFEGYLSDYIENIVQEKYKNGQIIKDYLIKYKEQIINNASAYQCLNLDQNTINVIVNSMQLNTMLEESSVKTYYSNMLSNTIRKEIFIPYIEECLSYLKESAQSTISSFEKYISDLQNLIINQKKFNHTVGEYYKDLVVDYLNTIDGEKNLNKLLSSGNNLEHFLKYSSEILSCIVLKDKAKNGTNSIFNIPLIEEWTKRLKKTEEKDILLEVSETFRRDLENRFFFYSTSTLPQKVLTLYTLHLGDEDWGNNTSLYKSLISNIENLSDSVCFINAGYDHKVEAFQFYNVTDRLIYS